MTGIITFIKSVFKSDDTDNGPEEDIHQDENATVGDTRYRVIPMGKIFNYDIESHHNQIYVYEERYRETATYNNGNHHYDWMNSDTIFRGSIEKWNRIKNEPEEYRKTIPVHLNEIVNQVDLFIEKNGEYITREEYPHSIIKINE